MGVPTGEKAITYDSLIMLPILLVQGGQFILDTLLTKSSHKLYSTPQVDSGFIKQKVHSQYGRSTSMKQGAIKKITRGKEDSGTREWENIRC